jgi:hypothetical protein
MSMYLSARIPLPENSSALLPGSLKSRALANPGQKEIRCYLLVNDRLQFPFLLPLPAMLYCSFSVHMFVHQKLAVAAMQHRFPYVTTCHNSPNVP